MAGRRSTGWRENRIKKMEERRRIDARRANCDCIHTHQGLYSNLPCDAIFTDVPGTPDTPPKLWRVGCSRLKGHEGMHRACDVEECGLWEWLQ
jgi:hypothetical protein